MGRHIVMMKLIYSLGHCECDGHTVHKTMRLPILRFFWEGGGKTSHHPGLSAPLQPRFDSLRILAFLRAKIVV